MLICTKCNKEYETGKFCKTCGNALQEKSSGRTCPACGAFLSEDSDFCSECGARLNANSDICANCGAELSAGAKFCRKCGTKVGNTLTQQNVAEPTKSATVVRVINSNVGTFPLQVIDKQAGLYATFFIYYPLSDTWNLDEGILEFGICDDEYWTHKYVGADVSLNGNMESCYTDGENNRVTGLSEDGAYIIWVEITNIGIKTAVQEASFENIQYFAESGNPFAQHQLGCYYITDETDYQKAFMWCKKAAEQGLAISQFFLAMHYKTGVGCKKNANEAFKWFQQAAESGIPGAYGELGFCYLHGVGVGKKARAAVEWFKKGAECNDSKAMYGLAYCLISGLGISPDRENSLVYLKKAAELGNEDAQDLVSKIESENYDDDDFEYDDTEYDDDDISNYYDDNDSDYDDYDEDNDDSEYDENDDDGRYDFTDLDQYDYDDVAKNAGQGSPIALFIQAECLASGIGVKRNVDKAKRCYRSSVESFKRRAKQGEMTFQVLMGNCYRDGKGAGRDMRAAIKMYRRAANQGSQYAQRMLSELGENY